MSNYPPLRTKCFIQFLQSLGFMFVVLVLKVVYDLAYAYLISPYFSWTIPTYPMLPNAVKVAESYVLTLMVALTFPRQAKKPSDFIMLFFGTAVILPMLTLYGLADRDHHYTYMVFLTYLVVLTVVKALPGLRIPVVRGGFKLAVISAEIATMVTLLSLVLTVGLQHFNLRFWDYASMVQNRLIIQSRLDQTDILKYFYFLVFIVFMPTIIITALAKRRYFSFAIASVGQILLTGLTVRRHTLIILPLLLWAYILANKRRSAPMLMMVSFTGVIVITTLLSLKVPCVMIVGTWMERFFFAPNRTNYAYYEFFSQAGHVYLSNTKLSFGLMSYPFEMSPERMVGYYALDNPATVASAGFLATSYMHFGFTGMIMFGVAVGGLLKLADSLIVGRLPLTIGVPLSIILFDSLLRGSDLSVWFLTFGGFVGMVMLFLLGVRNSRTLEVPNR